MWTAAAPDRCMILSGLHQRVIGKALDYVAWTTARLRENWWTRLQALALIIRTLIHSYLMWQYDFSVDAVGLLYAIKIGARFYKVQY